MTLVDVESCVQYSCIDGSGSIVKSSSGKYDHQVSIWKERESPQGECSKHVRILS